jgi:hypothetical protein
VATVNPSVYQALSRDWDFNNDYEEGTDDFLSSEGCFACQMNGGSRSKKKRRPVARTRRSLGSPADDKKDDYLLPPDMLVAASGVGNVSSIMPSEKLENFEIDLELRPDQTAHRRRVFKIQPATTDLVKSAVEYRIVRDPSGQLELKRKSGVWGLFFLQRVEIREGGAPLYFPVLIRGWPTAQQEPSQPGTHIFNALVRIKVVS